MAKQKTIQREVTPYAALRFVADSYAQQLTAYIWSLRAHQETLDDVVDLVALANSGKQLPASVSTEARRLRADVRDLERTMTALRRALNDRRRAWFGTPVRSPRVADPLATLRKMKVTGRIH